MIENRAWQIFYYVNGERFASRSRFLIPRLDEEVRLSNVCYRVEKVVWVEDQAKDYDNHVAIELEQV